MNASNGKDPPRWNSNHIHPHTIYHPMEKHLGCIHTHLEKLGVFLEAMQPWYDSEGFLVSWPRSVSTKPPENRALDGWTLFLLAFPGL